MAIIQTSMVDINDVFIRVTDGGHLIRGPSKADGANTGAGNPLGTNGRADMETMVAAMVTRITIQYRRGASLAAPVGMNGQTIGCLLKNE